MTSDELTLLLQEGEGYQLEFRENAGTSAPNWSHLRTPQAAAF